MILYPDEPVGEAVKQLLRRELSHHDDVKEDDERGASPVYKTSAIIQLSTFSVVASSSSSSSSSVESASGSRFANLEKLDDGPHIHALLLHAYRCR